MKNQNLSKGQKLNKKELRSITGGLMRCYDPMTGSCFMTGPKCGETICRFVLEPEDPFM
ncbi:bacteriocin-like protein [Chryseobacterium sp. BIGb0232]|nr:bacteriocin-like protein [Chryseobacterium sp. BIGb0232]ROS20513.1 bacteriocin-like protein [Chryseobacterium nakagawai]